MSFKVNIDTVSRIHIAHLNLYSQERKGKEIVSFCDWMNILLQFCSLQSLSRVQHYHDNIALVRHYKVSRATIVLLFFDYFFFSILFTNFYRFTHIHTHNRVLDNQNENHLYTATFRYFVCSTISWSLLATYGY